MNFIKKATIKNSYQKKLNVSVEIGERDNLLHINKFWTFIYVSDLGNARQLGFPVSIYPYIGLTRA